MATGVAVGLGVVGAGTSIYGQYKEGKAKERAAKAQASAKRRQAAELLRRTDVELEQLARETDDFVADQITSFAAAGVDVGSGVSLLAAEETKRKAMEESLFRLEEARWQAQELEIGAEGDIQFGSDARSAARISSIGTAINAGSNIFDLTSRSPKGAS